MKFQSPTFYTYFCFNKGRIRKEKEKKSFKFFHNVKANNFKFDLGNQVQLC